MSDTNTLYGFPKIGQDEPTLKQYGLDHAILIRAAQNTQKSTGVIMGRELANVEKFINGAIANPTGSILDSLTYFPVPYCNLDDFDLDFKVFSNCHAGQNNWSFFRMCLLQLMSHYCPKTPGWPYKAWSTTL